MNNLELLQKLPNVQIILSDDMKTICSVKITVKRMEKITSGSMQFDHARYLTFGQTVVFCSQDVGGDQSGALFFKVESAEEAKAIIDNIVAYIPHEKEEPENCVLIGE